METIIVKAKEFYKYVESCKAEQAEALEITIATSEYTNKKYIQIDFLECGGLGLISNDEDIEEMDNDEILDIK